MDGDDRTAAERRKVCQPNQSSSIHQAEHAQNPVLALAFLTLLAVQAGHEAEHLVELLQRFVLHFAVASGILGQFFHPELLHLAYNLLLFWLLLLVYTLSGAQRPRLWRRGMASWWLLSISFVIQSYHLFEHFVKMWQFVDTGRLGTPGILGHEFDLILVAFLVEYVYVSAGHSSLLVGRFSPPRGLRFTVGLDRADCSISTACAKRRIAGTDSPRAAYRSSGNGGNHRRRSPGSCRAASINRNV